MFRRTYLVRPFRGDFALRTVKVSHFPGSQTAFESALWFRPDILRLCVQLWQPLVLCCWSVTAAISACNSGEYFVPCHRFCQVVLTVRNSTIIIIRIIDSSSAVKFGCTLHHVRQPPPHFLTVWFDYIFTKHKVFPFPSEVVPLSWTYKTLVRRALQWCVQARRSLLSALRAAGVVGRTPSAWGKRGMQHTDCRMNK